ncbi:DUF47 family protein [Petrocella sp. FN5]|uniref:DUF47 family protein n=1 Tax=Petrocella sp. FN5 TaxID=3032002 RepID=UPI0023DB6326|nr:DUF47 family protein [Petrocella sp. FN5]MDF1618837.1 DUF47 family protein [Petrocella sp. FN5]
MNIFQDRNRELELEIDLYLNCLQKGAMTFYEGIKDYMTNNCQQFEERVKVVVEQESEADEHLKNLKFILYRYNLVPDLSADILELMDSMDDIGDISKQMLLDLQVEQPKIEEDFKEDFILIAKTSRKAVETLIRGVRVYFTEYKTIEDYISKVYFYESEVDKLEHKLKIKIFADKDHLKLSEKMHQRYFAQKTARLSDIAEEMAIKLSVFRFKRGI